MDVGGERAVILDDGATICQSYHMSRCYYPIGTIAPLGGHCPGFGKRCVCVCETDAPSNGMIVDL